MNSLEDEIQDDGLLDDVVLVPSSLLIESFSSQLVTRLGINSQQLRAETALAYSRNVVQCTQAFACNCHSTCLQTCIPYTAFILDVQKQYRHLY